jgi:DNA-binding transcriptional MerR regulator
MQIGALADKVGISRDAIRFYEKMGLVQSQRLANGYRSYGAVELEILDFIKTAQEMGLTLSQIQNILPMVRGEGVPSELVQLFLAERIRQIEERMAALQTMKDRLVGLRELAACPIQLARAADRAEVACEGINIVHPSRLRA